MLLIPSGFPSVKQQAHSRRIIDSVPRNSFKPQEETAGRGLLFHIHGTPLLDCAPIATLRSQVTVGYNSRLCVSFFTKNGLGMVGMRG